MRLVDSTRLGRPALIPKLPNHLIESIDFVGVATIGRLKYGHCGLESWNFVRPVFQGTGIDNFRHHLIIQLHPNPREPAWGSGLDSSAVLAVATELTGDPS